MSLAIMLTCLGMFIYIVQAVVFQFLLGPITKAESERASKKCLKYIVHQLFLVACIASDVDSAVEVRLWSFYLFGALVLYKMRRGLCYVERHLDSISVLGFSEGGASSYPGGGGEEKRKQRQTSTTRSIGMVLFLLVLTLAMLNVILYPELLTIFDSSSSGKGNKDIHVSPLFMYDSMSFLFAVALLALKYLVLLQEQANEEKEQKAEEEERQQRRRGERREEDGSSSSSSSRNKPSPPPPPSSSSSILGMEEEALLKWGTHVLNFALALLTIVHHIHAWCLKGIQGNVTDLLFFFLLHRWLWRVIILARAAWNAHILAKTIHTLFPEASPADLCKQEEADVCCICLKALRRSVKKLPCNHLIHSACLLQCLEKCGAGAAAAGPPRRQGQQQQLQQQQQGRGAHGGGGREALATAASLGNWLMSEKAARCPLCRSALIPPAIAAEEEENDGNGFADRGGATRMFSGAAMPHRTNLGRGSPIATQTHTQSTTRWTNSRSSAFVSVNENASTTTSTSSLPPPPPSEAAQTSSSPLIPPEEVDAHDHMAAAAMEERPLFRFSTEDLPGFDWFPLALPQFTLEVMRRQAPTANITNIVATGGGRSGSTAEGVSSISSSSPPAQPAAGSVVEASSEGGQQGDVASAARGASSGGGWRAVTRWLPFSMGRQRHHHQQQQQEQERG